MDRISAEELTVPPGMDELFSLLRLQAHNESGRWDAIIVDCAPTGETLRLLSFPDVARWWIDKVFPYEKQILAAARPIARSLLDISLPSSAVFADMERLSQNLIAMNEILRDRQRCTIRLVMNPDKMVIGEAMRTFTYLNLYGYLTDAVIVNRLFPAGVGDYFAAWRRVQEEHLELVHSAFAPVPVLSAPYFEQEVVGAEMLDRLADAPVRRARPGGDPARRDHPGARGRRGRGAAALALPFANKGDISLKKIGLELIVGVDGQKRTIMLPPALAGFRPTAATFEDGRAGGAIRWIARSRPSTRTPGGRSRSGDDVLSRLEQRLDRASEAAERLISEAAAAAVRKPPPAGWQQPEPEAGRARRRRSRARSSSCCRRSTPCAIGSRPSSSSGSAWPCARSCWRCGP